MNWKELVGKRVLVKIRKPNLIQSEIEEMYVIEVSPSGRYVKLSCDYISSAGLWYDVKNVELLEVLD